MAHLSNTNKVATFFTTYSFQRNIIHLGFKIVVIISAIYFVSSIYSTKSLQKQQKSLLFYSSLTTNWTEKQLSLQFNSTEDIFIFLQDEIRDRQVKTNVWFRDEVVKITSLLVSEKEKHLRTTVKLNETIQLHELELKKEKQKTDGLTKLFKAEKNTLEANATLYKKAFDYMSYAIGRLEVPYHGVDNYTRYASARLGMLPLGNVQQLKPEYGPVVNDFLSFRYRNDIPSCIEVNANRSVFIAVISAPANFEKRNSIRQTWRQHLNSMNKDGLVGLAGFGFILGMTENKSIQEKIEEESKMYGDIIQIEISDFYRNLTTKLIGLFNWLYRNCAKVDFLFKVDDDVYVNVRNLVQLIQFHHPLNQSIIGSAGSLPVNRNGKWGISKEEWPWSHYPPYFWGPAILIPQSAIVPLLAASQTIPLMPFDDVYLTGMCTEKAGIKLLFSSRSFSVFKMKMPVSCDIRRAVTWLTGNHQISHNATQDFYFDKTHECIETDSTGANKSVGHNQLVHISLQSIIYDGYNL